MRGCGAQKPHHGPVPSRRRVALVAGSTKYVPAVMLLQSAQPRALASGAHKLTSGASDSKCMPALPVLHARERRVWRQVLLAVCIVIERHGHRNVAEPRETHIAYPRKNRCNEEGHDTSYGDHNHRTLYTVYRLTPPRSLCRLDLR